MLSDCTYFQYDACVPERLYLCLPVLFRALATLHAFAVRRKLQHDSRYFANRSSPFHLIHRHISIYFADWQANSQMEVEMLQQQLDTSKKEITSLKRRLEAATAALAAANISTANPALLRVMQAGAKGGPHRGAGGTPHALALAWAREEAARLSPALALVQPKTGPFRSKCGSETALPQLGIFACRDHYMTPMYTTLIYQFSVQVFRNLF